MKIISLTAENIKKLVAVEIAPDGNLVQITGKNGAGKTSVLDAIWWALAGTDAIQSQPIRKGESKARIKLDLGNEKLELVVERRFTANGSTLEVRNADGDLKRSPQKLLDDMLGALSFDPLGFMRQKPKDQAETLRKLVGLDTTAIEEKRAKLYEERRDKGRDYKAAKGALDEAPAVAADTPDEPVSIEGLLAEQKEALALRSQEYEREQNIEELKIHLQEAHDDVTEAKRKLAEKEARLAAICDKLDEAQEVPEIKYPNPDAIGARISEAGRINGDVERKRQRARLAKKVRDLETEGKALSTAIEACDKEKADLIAKAKMPVEGLGFGEGCVTFGGLPLDQASDAQQLEIGVAIAAALAPKLRVLRIRDGSLLDDDAMKRLAGWAAERDFQIWLERVDSSGAVGVVIEDGAVRSSTQQAAVA